MATELPDGVGVATLTPGAPGERFVRLRDAVGATSFGLNLVVLAPGERMRVHRHSGQEEVYVVWRGVLDLSFADGVTHEFGVGSVIRVAPEVRRQLVNRGPETLEVLALGSMVDRTHVSRDAEAFTSFEATEAGTPQTVPLPEDLEPARRR